MRNFLSYIFNKFYSGLKGFVWLFKEENSMWFHFLVSVAVIVLGIIFSVTLTEWAILLLTIGLVIAVEMINSAMESMVDLVTFSYNVNAKKIKEIGAAATLFTSLVAIAVGLIIFLPYFIEVF